MRRAQAAPGVLLGRLVVGLVLGLVAALVVSPAVVPQAAARTTPVLAEDENSFEPALGVTFNDPATARSGRLILQQVLKSVRSTEAGEQVRIAAWAFDDRPARDALVAAAARGVKVQVVVSGRVDNDNWDALRTALNNDDSADTFAVQCRGGCRSRAPIMHSKFYMFSRVGDMENVTMVSSSNLTEPARYRQWNDLVTTRSAKVYDFLARVFDDYAKDEPVADPSQVQTLGDYRVFAYPVEDSNPQLNQLRSVRCHGATGRTGTADGRTRIRVAVAGWFDTYGEAIAKKLRSLWDRGCDVKVVTTLAGRGVNRAFRATYGRGPVPMRQLAWDLNGDGLPDRYLHQKSLAISGVFGDDTSSSVVLTGSPNWSLRAARSEEVLIRVLDRPGLTRRYLARVDRLFSSRFASSRVTSPAQLHRSLVQHGRVSGQLPEWLELD